MHSWLDTTGVTRQHIHKMCAVIMEVQWVMHWLASYILTSALHMYIAIYYLGTVDMKL